MGYKIPDLKEDVKEAIAAYIQGSPDFGNDLSIELQIALCEIVDKQFEKILYK